LENRVHLRYLVPRYQEQTLASKCKDRCKRKEPPTRDGSLVSI
jgi:hypothetical protein